MKPTRITGGFKKWRGILACMSLFLIALPLRAGVTVVQYVSPGATNWPGSPVLDTMANFSTASVGESFNGAGGNTNLSQTFTVATADFALHTIDIFAGIGSGTGSGTNIVLNLYDLGTQTAPNPSNYAAAISGGNLWGSGAGLSVGYVRQNVGVLEFDFTGVDQVTLTNGHTYAFELTGVSNTIPVYWYRAASDTYSGGAAYRNEAWINGTNARDFAMAVYATNAATYGIQYLFTNTASGFHSWNGAANWSPNGVPGANDFASISLPGTYTVTLNNSAAVNTLALGTNGTSSNQTLLITAPAALPVTFTVRGSALVDASGILTCSSNVTINCSSNATVAGTIQPLAGQIVFNQVSASSNSVWQFLIGGPTFGIQYGTVTIAPSTTALPMVGAAGDFGLAGTLDISFTNGYAPNDGDTFMLFSFPKKHGGFDAVSLGSASNGVVKVQLPTEAQSLIAVFRMTNATTPVWSSMPDQTNAIGSTVTFSAPAVGVVPYTYQWQFNGTNLIGETNATLVIPNVQLASAGDYCVTVTDVLLQTNTWCATLSVFSSPVFTLQPVGQTVSNGGTVTLSATVSSPLPVQYQWRCNGVNIPGATGPALTVTTNAQNWHGGSYDLVVASPLGVMVSTNAQVTVTSPATLPFTSFPGGYIYVNAVTNDIIFSGSGNNTGATSLPGQPPIAGSPAAHTMWLQWYVSPYVFNNPVVGEINTLGSDFDTVAAVYTCAGNLDVTNLTLQNSCDDCGIHHAVDLPIVFQPGTTYYFAVDGYAGATGNIVLNCMVNTNLLSVAQLNDTTTGPSDQAAPSWGGTATFSLTVTNASSLTCQWNKGGWLKIPGATNSTLTLSNVTASDVYSVTVTGTNGQSVDSRRATLEIGPSLSFAKLGLLLQQLNQTNGGYVSFLKFMAPALSSSFPSVSAGTIGSQVINNFVSLTAQGEPSTSGIGGSARYYLLTPTTNGTMVIDTMNSTIATLLKVYTNYGTLFPPLLGSDRSSAPDGIHSQLRFTAAPKTNYIAEVDGVLGGQDQIYLNWRLGTPPNTVGPVQNLAVTNGSTVKLQSGENSNVTSPTYQWQRNGVNIPGATNANYTNSSIQFDQCGSYSVVVSNLMGVVTNAIALVTVDSLLKIASAIPAHLLGSATQTTVLQLSTNLASWKPLYTNNPALLPVNYLDTDSTNRGQGFYRLKNWP